MRLLSGHMTVKSRSPRYNSRLSAQNHRIHFPTRQHYATSQAQADLAGSGIACPPFRDYSDRLVSFMRAHPEVGSAAMV